MPVEKSTRDFLAALVFGRKLWYSVKDGGDVHMSDEIIAGIIGAAGAIIAALIPEIVKASPRTKQRILLSVVGALTCVGLFFGGRWLYGFYREHQPTWTRETLSAGWRHTVGLRKDGTVAAVGCNDDGQCNVSDWRDMVAVSVGGGLFSGHTVGLRKDGTVAAVGLNNWGECDVSDWRDMVAVSAGDLHTVGLRKDGTVAAVGNNGFGRCNVSDWRDIQLP